MDFTTLRSAWDYISCLTSAWEFESIIFGIECIICAV